MASTQILFFTTLVLGLLIFAESFSGSMPGVGIPMAIGFGFLIIMVLSFWFLLRDAPVIDINIVRDDFQRNIRKATNAAAFAAAQQKLYNRTLTEKELDTIFNVQPSGATALNAPSGAPSSGAPSSPKPIIVIKRPAQAPAAPPVGPPPGPPPRPQTS